LLENYFFPAALEAQVETFVDHCNHQRYHESINNLTSEGACFGRGQAILKQRERIKPVIVPIYMTMDRATPGVVSVAATMPNSSKSGAAIKDKSAIFRLFFSMNVGARDSAKLFPAPAY
jgi:hypothetical protein